MPWADIGEKRFYSPLQTCRVGRKEEEKPMKGMGKRLAE